MPSLRVRYYQERRMPAYGLRIMQEALQLEVERESQMKNNQQENQKEHRTILYE